MIKLSTFGKLPEFKDFSGIEVEERLSQSDIKIVLDTERLGLNSFIDKINRSCNVKDLTIEEPPIEGIIKEFYTK